MTYKEFNMQQVKISINEKQADFMNDHISYGFKDKSSMVRNAIDKYIKELELQKLKESDELYNEICEKDSELKDFFCRVKT
jgi:metal-responsive CopG/Arc/MetJ family transcriptional regulator